MEHRGNPHITDQATNPAFLDEIRKTAAGKKMLDCIQCGVCAGSCHARFAMDYSPMQIIKMVQLGLREDVLSSSTIWICASCYTCTSRCPQGIDIPILMSQLKNTAIKSNIPAKIPTKPKFHKTFTEIIGKYGRMHEPELQVRLMDKSDPSKLVNTARLGFRMWRKGKVRLSPSRIKQTRDVEAIFKSAMEKEGEKK